MLPRASLQMQRGTTRQAIDYIVNNPDKPNPEYYEDGIQPIHGGNRITYDMVANAMKNPKENIVLFNQYRRCYKELDQLELKKNMIRPSFMLSTLLAML